MASPSSNWSISCSAQASRIFNPIRAISDAAKPSSSPKPVIRLSVGDPTIDKNLPPSKMQLAALHEAIASGQYDGYAPAVGLLEARVAVADYWKRFFVSTPAALAQVDASGVVMTSGGSHAIQMAIAAIANPGDNILLPAPGFPHYATICKTYGIEARFYHLDPRHQWEANMEEIKALRDDRTKLLVMTNPSNPCGSNFSREHVRDFVETAASLHLPIFSDEIYAGMVFQDESNPTKAFTSVVDIESDTPRVVLGGTAKSHLVPGWRVGWLLFVDPAKVGSAYLYGIQQEANLIVGPNSLAQASLPGSLLKSPPSHLSRIVSIIEKSAMYFYTALSATTAARSTPRMLEATMPQAAMYVMVELFLDAFNAETVPNDVVFCEALMEEENVVLIPGTAFHAPGSFRVVITRPVEVLEEAVQRIEAFCERHRNGEAKQI